MANCTGKSKILKPKPRNTTPPKGKLREDSLAHHRRSVKTKLVGKRFKGYDKTDALENVYIQIYFIIIHNHNPLNCLAPHYTRQIQYHSLLIVMDPVRISLPWAVTEILPGPVRTCAGHLLTSLGYTAAKNSIAGGFWKEH